MAIQKLNSLLNAHQGGDFAPVLQACNNLLSKLVMDISQLAEETPDELQGVKDRIFSELQELDGYIATLYAMALGEIT